MEYKRTTFIINRRFQFKFAFFVCSWIFVLSLVYPIAIYNIFEFFIKHLSQNSTVTALAPDKLKNIENEFLMWLGVLQLIFLMITFILSIFISHRIAGPLFKLKRAIDEVTKGNYDQRIVFRKMDHFPELQDSFNEMIQSISTKIKKQ